MLILSRELGQSVIINGNIWVTIHKIDRGQVKLCFHADEDITIDREEVHNEKLERLNKDPQ